MTWWITDTSIGPVSYTQLDVYKRQGQSNLQNGFVAKILPEVLYQQADGG